MNGKYSIYYLFMCAAILIVVLALANPAKKDSDFGKIQHVGNLLQCDVLDGNDTMRLTFTKADLDSMSELTYDLVKRHP